MFPVVKSENILSQREYDHFVTILIKKFICFIAKFRYTKNRAVSNIVLMCVY